MADSENEQNSNVFELSDEDIDRLSKQIDILIDAQVNNPTISNNVNIPDMPVKNYELVDEIITRQPINLSLDKPRIIYNTRLNDYYSVYESDEYSRNTTILVIFKEDVENKFSENIKNCYSLTFDELLKIEEFRKKTTSKVIYNNQLAEVTGYYSSLHVRIKIYSIVDDAYYKVTNKIVSMLDIDKINVPHTELDDIILNRLEQSKFNFVENILTNLFENNWYYTTINSYTNAYYIHFPKISIINSNDLTHEIHDIFVKFNIKVANEKLVCVPDTFQGARTSLSFNEYQSMYRHSHLPKRSNETNHIIFESFCIGTGQPISLSLAKLAQEIEENEFISFCLQLEPYLSWESLEGVPFIKLETIVNVDNYHPLTYDNFVKHNIEINQGKDYLSFDKYKHLEYVFEKNNDYTLIVPTDESIENNIDIYEHSSSIIVYVNSDKEYFIRNSSNRIRDRSYYETYLRNGVITLNNGITKKQTVFTPTEIKPSNTLDLKPVVHPSIIMYIKTYITNIIN
jgi:hypothetical protein